MTDYLEGLFAGPREERGEEPEVLRGRGLSAEEPVWVGNVRLAGEVVKEMGLPERREPEVEFRFLTRPEGEDVREEKRTAVSLRGPLWEREGERWEKKLRRESRRYDGGFYG